ncbi:hypothetical protein PMAYCL1PPCAC_22436, partial [Pristionchus mayeri]
LRSINFETELQLALARARDACDAFNNVSDISVEDLFVKNMSMVVMDVIDCIEMDTCLSSENIERVRFAFASSPSSRILQLGNSLALLFEKLMSDR